MAFADRIRLIVEQDDVMPKPFRVADLLPKMEKLRTSQMPLASTKIDRR